MSPSSYFDAPATDPSEPEPDWINTQESQMIAGFGYDADRQVLTVELNGGNRYSYHGVPAQVYTAFKDADSKGRFFLSAIKDRYQYDKE